MTDVTDVTETDRATTRVRRGECMAAFSGYWLRLVIMGRYSTEIFGGPDGEISREAFDTMNLTHDGGFPYMSSCQSYAGMAPWSYLRKHDVDTWRQIRQQNSNAYPVYSWRVP